jgi:hypothetical protein
MMGLM